MLTLATVCLDDEGKEKRGKQMFRWEGWEALSLAIMIYELRAIDLSIAEQNCDDHGGNVQPTTCKEHWQELCLRQNEWTT